MVPCSIRRFPSPLRSRKRDFKAAAGAPTSSAASEGGRTNADPQEARLGACRERGDQRGGVQRSPPALEGPRGGTDFRHWPGRRSRPAGAGIGGRGGPLGRALPGQARREIRARPADHRREVFDDLQQFLRVWRGQGHLAGRPGAQDRAVDDQDRRHGRKAGDDRLRRSCRQDGPRRAALSPPLRRGVVDGGAVDRLRAGQARRFRAAARLGQIPENDDLHGPGDGAGAARLSSIPGPMSKA